MDVMRGDMQRVGVIEDVSDRGRWRQLIYCSEGSQKNKNIYAIEIQFFTQLDILLPKG